MIKEFEETDKSAKNQQSNDIFSPSSVFDKTENENPNFNLRDEENYLAAEVDARLSDPTPKKAP